MPELWERQPGEGGKAYAAFSIYRDMGPLERTLAKATAAYFKIEGTVSKSRQSTLEEWSQKYQWSKRCRAWDDLLDRKTIKAKLDAFTEMNKRQLEGVKMLQGTALKHLKRLNDSNAEMSYDDVRKWMKDFINLERTIRGVPTQVIEHQTISSPEQLSEPRRAQQFDLSGLNQDETEDLNRLLRKMLGKRDPDAEPANVQANLADASQPSDD